ncbi:DUF2155 domain-containing protein [Sagittula sp. NFXS13]|uniref:DUF2155 domain-containing protein n=1 Tax=Sagittula marina TaxID=943940 RepID=A0A7W6DNZ8_9RHOB|nr:DUF2155 domain-containing protein [Sagittula marina]MBB3986109.1 hypothetical protein [Sagittula marina]
MKRFLSILALCLPVAVSAQEAVNPGTGAVLRGLDKLNAKVADFTLPNGGMEVIGLMEVNLRECRYPAGDPTGNAYAYLTIREAGVAQPVFDGWMIAGSPALNPLDHARYDVWVLRCTT